MRRKRDSGDGGRKPESADGGGTAAELTTLRRLAEGPGLALNNALASIVGRASMMKAEPTLNARLYRDVEAIAEAAATAVELTRRLLAFSPAYPLTRHSVSLNDIVRTVIEEQESAHPNIETRALLSDKLPDIFADPVRIREVLAQLCDNAVDAMPRGGALNFKTESVNLFSENADDSRLSRGVYVRLQVSDTGEGMDRETLHRAFEPFFSGKPHRGFAGLGLSQCHDIVARHEGDIRMYSKVGLGTTVTMHFPTVGPTDKASAASARADRDHGAVLIVDDDLRFLRAAERLVNKIGHRVLLALDGDEAIEVYEDHRDDICLVLIDLLMPGSDGRDLLQRLLRIDPTAKVIVCSGYVKDELRGELLALGATQFLPKPYTLAQLSDAIAQARDGASRS